MKAKQFVISLVFLNCSLGYGQSDRAQIKAILDHSLQSREVVTFQLQEYMLRRVPKLPAPSSASQWTEEAAKIRRHVLDEVVYHGWPKAWVDAPPKFEDLGPLPSGQGYERRKLRYEVVPGFYSTAVLYEPANLQGRVPGVLNLMGHAAALGKSIEFEQKRCINFALRGMVALSPEWIGMGELYREENRHWYEAHLDLVGTSGIGLMYLAMRRGLDYLAANPHVDTKRLGVTGLSGGGWQTITLSSLDDRVYASVPVAGFTSLPGRLDRLLIDPGDPGDLEQNASDFIVGQDYPTLTAGRAPRPTLLVNNAEDDCCYRAPLVKPYIFDSVKPFYALYGLPDAFQFHENVDPSTHNYELDNRLQAYRFFTKWFGLPVAEQEIPVDDQVLSYDGLRVGVPEHNLTILGLARKIASEISRPPIPSDAAARAGWATSAREKLKAVVRYDPVKVREAWAEGNTKDKGIESLWYRFELSNGLSATGIRIKAITTPNDAPLTIVLDDMGKKAAADEFWDRPTGIATLVSQMSWVSHLVNCGQQVLVLDLLFTGDVVPNQLILLYTEMLAATGQRPLGLEVAQLIALAHWANGQWHPRQLRLETAGPRSQVAALVASGLEPTLFSVLLTRAGMPSLSYILDKPVTYHEAPDLFCLDFFKDFDLDRLRAVAEPTRVISEQELKLPAAGK